MRLRHLKYGACWLVLDPALVDVVASIDPPYALSFKLQG